MGDVLFVGTEGLEPPKSRGRLVYSEEQLPLCDVPNCPTILTKNPKNTKLFRLLSMHVVDHLLHRRMRRLLTAFLNAV